MKYLVLAVVFLAAPSAQSIGNIWTGSGYTGYNNSYNQNLQRQYQQQLQERQANPPIVLKGESLSKKLWPTQEVYVIDSWTYVPPSPSMGQLYYFGGSYLQEQFLRDIEGMPKQEVRPQLWQAFRSEDAKTALQGLEKKLLDGDFKTATGSLYFHQNAIAHTYSYGQPAYGYSNVTCGYAITGELKSGETVSTQIKLPCIQGDEEYLSVDVAKLVEVLSNQLDAEVINLLSVPKDEIK